MSEGCLAGCCPHPRGDPGPAEAYGAPAGVGGVPAGTGCPRDLPWAPLPERAAHLYGCQGLSTYRIADLTGIGRQGVTRVLPRAGIPDKPRGGGRRRPPRGAGAGVPAMPMRAWERQPTGRGVLTPPRQSG